MLFLHGAECAGAVVDKLKERFSWLDVGPIEEEVCLLPWSSRLTCIRIDVWLHRASVYTNA